MATIQVHWPDGTKGNFPAGTGLEEAARDWNPKKARRAFAGKIDGKVVDIYTRLTKDCELDLVLPEDPEGLEVYRHSTAHLLAHAVKEIFPAVQIGIG